jgi:hypothetical protein
VAYVRLHVPSLARLKSASLYLPLEKTDVDTITLRNDVPVTQAILNTASNVGMLRINTHCNFCNEDYNLK